MKESIKKFAQKYGDHYFEGYFYRAEDKHIPFEIHYKSLKFNKEFFYELIYEDPLFLEYLSEKRKDVFLKSYEDEEFEEKEIEKIDDAVIKETARLYKQYFKEVYLYHLNEKMNEIKDELKFAAEDEKYFENRKYIGEEETIGGKVTEEERIDLINEAKQKQQRYHNELKILNKLKEELI
jgi:hypothetical protein